jgi:hypothetical protein
MSGPLLEEAHLLALKSASRVVLAAHGKGVAAAAACRLNEGSLSDCASPHHRERTLPVDVALQLELLGGSTAITSALARAHGCALVPLGVRCGGQAVADLERLGSEIGGYVTAQVRAMSDGVLTEAERAALARSLGELAEAARNAQASLLGPRLPMGRAGRGAK